MSPVCIDRPARRSPLICSSKGCQALQVAYADDTSGNDRIADVLSRGQHG